MIAATHTRNWLPFASTGPHIQVGGSSAHLRDPCASDGCSLGIIETSDDSCASGRFACTRLAGCTLGMIETIDDSPNTNADCEEFVYGFVAWGASS